MKAPGKTASKLSGLLDDLKSPALLSGVFLLVPLREMPINEEKESEIIYSVVN
jgi:hypothetical protein